MQNVRIQFHRTLNDFSQLDQCHPLAEQPVDLLFIECPNLNERQCSAVRAFTKRSLNRNCVLIYRYANHKNLALLKQDGIRTLKAPLDENSLALTIEHYCSNIPGNTPDMLKESARYPAHRFTQKQLEKISALPSAVECECPHHLAELLQGLKAFEHYSGECISKDDDDSALHGKIQRNTAHARYQLEILLEEVLEAEGLSLQ
jgi:hypothetical protein